MSSPPPVPCCCCFCCCCCCLLFMRSLSSLILLSSSSHASFSLRFLTSSRCPSASQCVISILLLCRNRLEASLFCSFLRSLATATAAAAAGEEPVVVGPSGQVFFLSRKMSSGPTGCCGSMSGLTSDIERGLMEMDRPPARGGGASG